MLTCLYYVCILILLLAGISFILPIEAIEEHHGSSYFGNAGRLLKAKHQGLAIDGKNKISLSDSFRHCLILGNTGSGKTQKYLLPNILIQAQAGYSQIVTDVKGELMPLCTPYLQSLGYRVVALDFINPRAKTSLFFNPLQFCLDATGEVNETRVKNLASSLYRMSNKGVTTDGLWQQGAIELLEIGIKTLLHAPDKKFANMSSLIYLINCMMDGDGKKASTFITQHAPPDVQLLYNTFISSEPKIKNGKWSGAQACLAMWNTKEIRYITSTHTIDFQSLRHKKTVIFLRLPPGLSATYSPVISLLYSQLFNHILNTPLKNDDLAIMILADEFANIKPIYRYEEIISLLRSQRASISMCIQSINQLDKLYTKSVCETILSNCSSLICLPGIRSERDCKYITFLAGAKTVSLNVIGGLVNFHRRDLLTADEVRRMKDYQALYIFDNYAPMWIQPIPLYKNTTLLAQAGIQSIHNRLVAIATLPEAETQAEEKLLPDMTEARIEEVMENPEIATFKAKLKDILPH